MPLNPRLLRRLFAGGAVLIVLVVSGFYLRGILLERDPPRVANIPANVAQRTTGFTFSKSEEGRTLFTIHASREEKLKEGGRTELHDVDIVVYGRQSNRFDEIHGAEFQYDPRTEDVIANDDVQIDLQGDTTPGAARTDQSPPQEIKNPIHLKTSGLIFNRKTGLATTKEPIEFRLPEATGSAIGATYDSRGNVLTLHSAVRVVTTEKQKVTITAQKAVMTKEPAKAVLQSARVEQQLRLIEADKVSVFLRPDNTIDRVLGDGHVRIEDSSAKGFKVSAPQGEMLVGQKQQIRSGVLSGGVNFEGSGPSPAQGTAKRLLLEFGPENQVTKARAEGAVQLGQGPQDRSMQLQSDAVVLSIGNSRNLENAATSGAAQVLIIQGHTKTTITADQFRAAFNARNRPSSISGSSNVKTVSTTAGRPDQITSSREIIATFNNQNAIQEVEQNGDFHYQQGQQMASSDRARYLPADETVTLIGSPRVQDSSGTVTAQTIQLNRKTGLAVAQREVKTTYTDLKAQPNGGMLGSADPIHVTGDSMVANRGTGEAKFTHARLWQSANIVEAPVINFDRQHRSLQAQAASQGGQEPSPKDTQTALQDQDKDKDKDKVNCVFVQPDGKGKSMPVDVTADRLSYVDAQRKAVFNGNVLIHSSETTVRADTVQVFLLPHSSQSGSQLDRIVAQGEIQVDQPGRKATGNQLVYTAQDDKLVMTAAAGKRPTIVDSQRGQISGDSLTFYRHDDRVVVDGKETSQTLIQTRIRDTSKK